MKIQFKKPQFKKLQLSGLRLKKPQLKIAKKTILILALMLVLSSVLGYVIKDQSEQSAQVGCDECVAPTPSEKLAALWSALNDTDEDAANESVAEPAHDPVCEVVVEPTILECDFIWFDSKHASCYDAKTDLWLVYKAIGEGVFADRVICRYNGTDARWESFESASANGAGNGNGNGSETESDIWLIRREDTQLASQLHLHQRNCDRNATEKWIKHEKKGATVQLGSGRAWFDQSDENGTNCYERVREIDRTTAISVSGGNFSCTAHGGVPPIAYDWKSDISGQIGNTSSFEIALPEGTHKIMLVVTDASGSSASASETVVVIVN